MENNQKKIRAILTGATGMVGEGVLMECLQHPDVEQVLVINRRPCGVIHPKLTEIIHTNFFDIRYIQSQLVGYNACFFCLGVSSVGMNEEDYTHMTYDLTIHVAETLVALNRDMTFCYISGASTDSSEQGRSMWARVKGKTENDLMKMPFKAVYAFRPALMKPTAGQKNVLKIYRNLSWLMPLFKLIFPGKVHTIRQLGLAMIKAARDGYPSRILEVKDIKEAAKTA